MLAQAASGGEVNAVELKAAATGAVFQAVTSVFRQDGAAFLLIRLLPQGDGAAVSASGENQLHALLEHLPEAVALTDGAGRVVFANHAFVELSGLLSAQAAVGANLDGWLGHSSVDFGVILGTLREARTLRPVATVLRGAYAAVEPVSVSAAAAGSGQMERFCFIIRAAERQAGLRNGQDALARTPEEIRDLVGRIPLKEIVRETTEIIEKLCIQAALDLAGDNRASASDMLGLSRQSLYSKMHRFGIGDLSGAGRE